MNITKMQWMANRYKEIAFNNPDYLEAHKELACAHAIEDCLLTFEEQNNNTLSTLTRLIHEFNPNLSAGYIEGYKIFSTAVIVGIPEQYRPEGWEKLYIYLASIRTLN